MIALAVTLASMVALVPMAALVPMGALDVAFGITPCATQIRWISCCVMTATAIAASHPGKKAATVILVSTRTVIPSARRRLAHGTRRLENRRACVIFL